MKRRKPKEVRYAQDGPNGRPAAQIAHEWTSKAKRRTHKRERREGHAEVELELPYLEPVRTEAWAYEQPCNEVERMSDIARW